MTEVSIPIPDDVMQHLKGQWTDIPQKVLEGVWFPDGFHGAMAELLCAIEEHREPEHIARNNLRSLSLCFAALQSAEQHKPVVPGTVHKLVI